ncbi:unnamed protein product [Acanthosepion pharaonis]|uniref:Uncharacterized protein n=1 Tax=Acanthosepion pharaonis TaxID=158019 RepID=A0A812E8M3_ACAPH|nr:unnamed protein product [Sepia pharaonis]
MSLILPFLTAGKKSLFFISPVSLSFFSTANNNLLSNEAPNSRYTLHSCRLTKYLTRCLPISLLPSICFVYNVLITLAFSYKPLILLFDNPATEPGTDCARVGLSQHCFGFPASLSRCLRVNELGQRYFVLFPPPHIPFLLFRRPQARLLPLGSLHSFLSASLSTPTSSLEFYLGLLLLSLYESLSPSLLEGGVDNPQPSLKFQLGPLFPGHLTKPDPKG